MDKFTSYLADNNISQKNFGEMVGVHQSVISRFAKKLAQPSPETAVKIERATGGVIRVEDWPAFAALKGRKHHVPLEGSK